MAEIHRLADGKVSVYARSLRGGETYYARFKVTKRSLANDQRYITETLSTSNLELAKERARQRYVEIVHLEKQNRAIRSGTVAEEIDLFMKDYETNLAKGISGYSPHMYRGFRKSIARYFRDYLGRKALQDVSFDDLGNYETWRQSYGERRVKEGGRGARYGLERISLRTLEWEINAFKQFALGANARRVFG